MPYPYPRPGNALPDAWEVWFYPDDGSGWSLFATEHGDMARIGASNNYQITRSGRLAAREAALHHLAEDASMSAKGGAGWFYIRPLPRDPALFGTDSLEPEWARYQYTDERSWFGYGPRRLNVGLWNGSGLSPVVTNVEVPR